MTHEDTMELNLIKNKKKKREFYAMTIACEIMAVLDPYIDDNADFDAALAVAISFSSFLHLVSISEIPIKLCCFYCQAVLFFILLDNIVSLLYTDTQEATNE